MARARKGKPVTDNTAAADASAALNAMKIPQLQALASELGVAGVSKLKKSQLIDAIRNGGVVTERTPRAAARSEAPVATATAEAPASSESDESAEERARRAKEAVVLAGLGDAGTEAGESASNGGQRQRRDRRGRGGQNGAGQNGAGQNGAGQNNGGQGNAGQVAPSGDAADGAQGAPEGASAEQGERRPQRQQGQQGGGAQGQGDDDDRNRRRRGRGRGRNRGRERDGMPQGSEGFDEDEVREDDELTPVGGIVDILDNYAFVRTTGYLPGKSDVYVSMNQVRRYGLRKGDAVTGAARMPRPGERGQRQKFSALAHIDKVNGMDIEAAKARPEFGDLTPLYPQQRLHLETDPRNLTNRVIDMVAPIGKGQRGLIVSPPKAGKTLVMQSIANAITANNPEVHLMIVLVDERPEEVTDFQRNVKGEVIASTFDRPAQDHTMVAELAIERAKRLVELGQDVMVLLDGITRLGRAYNLAAPASGRILSGGVDSSALYPPKKFFGAARNIENGGSLTILATALVETGSKMDEVIFEEFKGTGNMELKLSRQLADRRVFPAVDVNASGTRREEILVSPEELKVMWKLRRVLTGLETQAAAELLIGKLKENKTNAEFLMQVAKTTPGGENDERD